MPLISEKLKEILVCPEDKGALKELEKEKKLQCTVCGRCYPVEDGIPVMIPDENRKK
jgi:hypothetical protein